MQAILRMKSLAGAETVYKTPVCDIGLNSQSKLNRFFKKNYVILITCIHVNMPSQQAAIYKGCKNDNFK